MKTRKTKTLSAVLVAALVAAGLLAAVAMAWSQPQPRAVQQQQRPQTAQSPQQAQVPQPLPGGGPTQSDLNFAE